GEDVRRREPERLEPLRVQPHPHAVRAGPEHSHLPDARSPGERVDHVDDRVVREEDLVEPLVVGVEARHQQDVRRHLLDRDPLDLDAPGSWDSAALEAFWTRESDVFRSVPTSNVTVSVYEPSLALVEDM